MRQQKRIRKTFVERLRVLISWVCIGSLLAAEFVTDSAWKSSESVEETFVATSLLLVAIGCLGRIWALSYIAGRKEKELVMDGPYSMCRHPLYLFSFVGAFGVALATCTFTFPAMVTAGFLVFYPFIVAAEERRLLERHGAAYENYKKTTPSVLPAIWQYKTGYGWQFDPRTFQRGLLDCVWFFVAMGCMHIVMELHEAGYLAVYLRAV
jgi:protein-S-isoprenylcysteine O-methyltransferase Ste14